ncbi:hypothetical protein HanXRQr2_Chr05g0194681 [Helianthus annuus]|uniref:Uncharacterized protein n=1 Tax=Helianthus annuus TaxID=4232 RepID=A0A9K3IX04_HELAN|nr:hypothetical protein HanXRQr2_Chr05g0194681 [Helianthus annuus]
MLLAGERFAWPNLTGCYRNSESLLCRVICKVLSLAFCFVQDTFASTLNHVCLYIYVSFSVRFFGCLTGAAFGCLTGAATRRGLKNLVRLTSKTFK